MALPKTRSKIIDILNKSNAPISALDLLTKIKVNKTTIYRELFFLLGSGLINEVDFGDKKKRYELKDQKHHHHLVCLNCKTVVDVNIKESFNTPKDFKVIRHNLEFFGLCSSCQ